MGEDAQFSDMASLCGEGYPEKGASSVFLFCFLFLDPPFVKELTICGNC